MKMSSSKELNRNEMKRYIGRKKVKIAKAHEKRKKQTRVREARKEQQVEVKQKKR